MSATSRKCAILSVIVPAFNEASHIRSILHRLRSLLPCAEIIVVDDGSTDATSEILSDLAKSLDIRVLSLEKNGGKGVAVKNGLRFATRPWVAIQDADLEYDPEDLLRLVEIAAQGNRQVVYGSRYKGRGRVRGGAWLNFVGVKLLAGLEWVLFGEWLSDPHTCYKVIRRDVLQAIDIQSRGFELCAEINSKLLRAGYSIDEIPIRYSPRTVEEGKKVRLRDFFIAVVTYLRYRIDGFTTEAIAKSSSELVTRNHVYAISRILIGCMLLVAGGMKLSPLSELPLASWLVVPKPVVLGWAVAEFMLGWACITMVPHRLLHQVLTVVFSVFLLVLGVKWLSGEQRCDCVGSFAISLNVMAILDGMVLVLLVSFRKAWHRIWDMKRGFIASQVSNLGVVFPVLLLLCIGWFGSLDAARCYFGGCSVLVDSFSKFAGSVKQGEYADVSYRLTNSTSVPVRVLGAKSTCSCIAILDLPTMVEPGGVKSIRLRVRGVRAKTVQRESAELFFDDPTLRMVVSSAVVVHPSQ